ncbi:MAG: hypothetical protein PHS52_03990 [Desulfotomaculaceae bacterium]|nr:hypothetical protein [Desulfotomaculaceae bacterium]
MKRMFNPMLFLMSNVPDVERNLELIMSALQLTTDSVKNIKNGIDSFQTSILKMAKSMSGENGQEPPVPPQGPEPSVTSDPEP